MNICNILLLVAAACSALCGVVPCGPEASDDASVESIELDGSTARRMFAPHLHERGTEASPTGSLVDTGGNGTVGPGGSGISPRG